MATMRPILIAMYSLIKPIPKPFVLQERLLIFEYPLCPRTRRSRNLPLAACGDTIIDGQLENHRSLALTVEQKC